MIELKLSWWSGLPTCFPAQPEAGHREFGPSGQRQARCLPHWGRPVLFVKQPLGDPTRHARRRGAALIIVLWTLLILGLLLLGLNRAAQVTAALGQGELERVQARWVARAGVEQALAALGDDGKDVDSRDDLWFEDAAYFENVELAPPDGTPGFVFRVVAPPVETADEAVPRFGITDEASRLSLNAARPNQLALLPDITTQQADAVFDWIDTNENARPGGAERGYYNDLDFPYDIRNGPMRTHREMLLVRDVDAAAFYSEDADLDGVLSRNENDGDATYPPDDADRTLRKGLAAFTTVYAYELNQDPAGSPRVNLKQPDTAVLTSQFNMTPSLAEAVRDKGGDARSLFDFVGVRGEDPAESEDQIEEVTLDWLAERWESFSLSDDERLPAKLNVNTASREVLLTVPGLDEAVADDIINARATGGAFLGVGELLSRNVLDERQFRRFAPSFTVRSNVFSIISKGAAPGGTTRTLRVVVDRGGDVPVIVDWREGG